MQIPKIKVHPIAGGEDVEFPAPTPAAFIALRKLRRDPEFEEVYRSDDKSDKLLVDMLSNAAHAIECARALRVPGLEVPDETTYESACAFATAYAVDLVLDGESEGGDVDENPTGTAVEPS